MRSALLLPLLLVASCVIDDDSPREYPRTGGDGVSSGDSTPPTCSCDLSAACDVNGTVNCFCDADCPSDGTLALAVEDPEDFASVSCDGSPCQVNLGDVPVYATRSVTFRMHTTGAPVVITGTPINAVTGTWRVTPPQSEYPVVLGAQIWAVTVAFEPEVQGAASVEVEVLGNASGGPYLLAVQATAVYVGAPDIEVQYGTYRGPAPGNCSDGACVIPDNHALDFGNVELGSTGSVQIILRNTAECAPYVGVDPCVLCQLTIDDDPDGQNIGFGFQPASDPDGVFSFVGSIGTPVDIPQRNIAAPCNESGEIRILLNFHAPVVAGEFGAVIVVESNDPDEALIEIPVRAAARSGPVAIAKFREIDPTNPSSPWTNPDDIQPLQRAYFDGRDSYDPGGGTIASYQWQVIEYPSGLDTNDFQMQGETAGLFSFWLPLAGHYVVQLTVWNEDGIESGETPSSRVEFDVIPGARIRVQLTWDDPSNDQNLHLLYLPESDVLCADPWDCYAGNPIPIWDAGSPVADGANPSMGINDTHGLGPESISIDAPVAATYRVAVHYWADYTDSSPTRNTVRIFFNGLQVAEYQRTLAEETVWHVANLVWHADGTGTISHLEPDSSGQIGIVELLTRETCTN